LCFPWSRFSYQEILHLGKLVTSDILSDVWVSHYTSSFLVWCLENLLCMLSISILIRLGCIREHVENLTLSWIKIQNERRCLVTWDQGGTLRIISKISFLLLTNLKKSVIYGIILFELFFNIIIFTLRIQMHSHIYNLGIPFLASQNWQIVYTIKVVFNFNVYISSLWICENFP